MHRKLLVCLFLVTPLTTLAESQSRGSTKNLDAASEQALSQTQRLLRDSKAREQAIQASPEAKAAHQKVQAVSGSKENTDAIYGLSADIFATLTNQSGGDPEKMKRQLEEFQKNPEALMKQLTPEQRNQLKALANDIGQTGKPSSP